MSPRSPRNVFIYVFCAAPDRSISKSPDPRSPIRSSPEQKVGGEHPHMLRWICRQSGRLGFQKQRFPAPAETAVTKAQKPGTPLFLRRTTRATEPGTGVSMPLQSVPTEMTLAMTAYLRTVPRYPRIPETRAHPGSLMPGLCLLAIRPPVNAKTEAQAHAKGPKIPLRVPVPWFAARRRSRTCSKKLRRMHAKRAQSQLRRYVWLDLPPAPVKVCAGIWDSALGLRGGRTNGLTRANSGPRSTALTPPGPGLSSWSSGRSTLAPQASWGLDPYPDWYKGRAA